MQLDQLKKKIKKIKSRPKRNLKMPENRSEKTQYVQVKEKNDNS